MRCWRSQRPSGPVSRALPNTALHAFCWMTCNGRVELGDTAVAAYCLYKAGHGNMQRASVGKCHGRWTCLPCMRSAERHATPEWNAMPRPLNLSAFIRFGWKNMQRPSVLQGSAVAYALFHSRTRLPAQATGNLGNASATWTNGVSGRWRTANGRKTHGNDDELNPIFLHKYIKTRGRERDIIFFIFWPALLAFSLHHSRVLPSKRLRVLF